MSPFSPFPFSLFIFLLCLFARSALAAVTLVERGELDVSREKYGYTSAVLVFEPNHGYLAEINNDVLANKTIRLWDWQNKKIVREYRWNDRNPLEWYRPDGKPGPLYEGSPDTLTSKPLVFSKDGRYLAACRSAKNESGHYFVRVWDTQSGAIVRDIRDVLRDGRHSACRALDFSPDSKALAVLGRFNRSAEDIKNNKYVSSHLLLFNTHDWALNKSYALGEKHYPLDEISYDTSGRYIAGAYTLLNRRLKGTTGSDVHDNRLITFVWDTEQDTKVTSRTMSWSWGNVIRTHLSFSADSRALLAYTPHGSASRIEDCLRSYDPPEIPSGFTKREFCTMNKVVQRWEWRTDTLRTFKILPFVHRPDPHPEDPDIFESVTHAIYSPTGIYIAVATIEEPKNEVRKNFDRLDKVMDFVIEIRDPETFEKLSEYRMHQAPTLHGHRLQISSDGRFIAFYSKRNLVKILEVVQK